MWKLLRYFTAITVSIGIVLLQIVPVLAGTSIDISVYARGSVGVSNFTVTYVSDTDMYLTWGYSADVVKVMVRAKYGSYPNEIPNDTTAPSDGYLVYYGSDNSTEDTSMDFNENPGPLYYSAWGQKADGTWYTTTQQANKEAMILNYIAFFLLALALTVISLKWYNILLSLLAAISWLCLWRYNLTNPPSNVAIGSTTQEWLTYLFIGMAIVTMLIYFGRRNRNATNGEHHGYDSAIPPENEARYNGGMMSESTETYRGRVRKAIRPNGR